MQSRVGAIPSKLFRKDGYTYIRKKNTFWHRKNAFNEHSKGGKIEREGERERKIEREGEIKRESEGEGGSERRERESERKR